MKILLCHFTDLGGVAGLKPFEIRAYHAPFSEDQVGLADILAVIGDGRILILRNRWGACGAISTVQFALWLDREEPGSPI